MHALRTSPALGLIESFAAMAYLFVLFFMILGYAVYVGATAVWNLARESESSLDEE